MSTSDLSPHYTADSHKEQAVNEAYDYYKNLYLSYYGTDGPQSSAEVPIESQTHSESGETPSFLTDTANKIKGVFNRQDGFGEVGAPFGEVDDVRKHYIEKFSSCRAFIQFKDSYIDCEFL